ncbi:MAG: hypothetical protein P8R54_12295 [Myxococcota bacterium]|nr:hypothetical protein [Myxococcota bacterium]
MSVSQPEVLAYAQRCKAERPNITNDELRGVLRARFVDGKDPLLAAAAFGGLGAVHNPVDWLKGLASIFRGLSRIFGGKDPAGIMDIIEGVIIIVQE